jgi:hypothetical protein
VRYARCEQRGLFTKYERKYPPDQIPDDEDEDDDEDPLPNRP